MDESTWKNTGKTVVKEQLPKIAVQKPPCHMWQQPTIKKLVKQGMTECLKNIDLHPQQSFNQFIFVPDGDESWGLAIGSWRAL
eukprot:3646769-Amphidinium_carterae.1